MAETSTIFGFMKYVSATDILSDFKKTVDSHFVNSLELFDHNIVIQRVFRILKLYALDMIFSMDSSTFCCLSFEVCMIVIISA